MRPTKLTLLLDEKIVTTAKRYGQRHRISLSKMVSRFLASLPQQANNEIGSKVRHLSGILPKQTSRIEYRTHLKRKFGF